MNLVELEQVIGLPEGFYSCEPERFAQVNQAKLLENAVLVRDLWDAGWKRWGLDEEWGMAKVLDPQRTLEWMEIELLGKLVSDWTSMGEQRAF